MGPLAVLLGLVLVGILATVAATLALLWIWGRRQPEPPTPCSVCGEPGCASLACMAQIQNELNDLANARLLIRDGLLRGTTFTDVTGKRIDPATVKPSGHFAGIPIVVDESMPDDEIELRSARDRVRVVNVGTGDVGDIAFVAPEYRPSPILAEMSLTGGRVVSAFDWPPPAPAPYDWDRDRAWSGRRV